MKQLSIILSAIIIMSCFSSFTSALCTNTTDVKDCTNNTNIDYGAFLIIVLLVLILLCAWVRLGWFYFISGIYAVFLGIFLIANVGFWLGIIIIGLGMMFLIMWISKL